MSAQETLTRLLCSIHCRCTLCRERNVSALDITNYEYRPFDEEGNTLDQKIRIIDMRRSKYEHYDNERKFSLCDLRKQFMIHDQESMDNSTNIIELKPIFRNLPVDWSNLTFLDLISPSFPGNTGMSFIEHKIPSIVDADGFLHSPRYNKLIIRNAKYAFFHKNMELMSHIMGFYRNPFVGRQNVSEWSNSFDFIHRNKMSLTAWTRMLNVKANMEVLSFLSHFKGRVHSYVRNLQLDNVNLWLEERREPYIFIDHLHKWLHMAGASYSLALNGLGVVWKQLMQTQLDYAALLEMIVNKWVLLLTN